MSWPPSWFLHTVGLVLRWILRCCVTVSYGWVTAVSNMLRFNFVFEVLGVWIFLGKMTTSYWLLWIGWVWMCKYCVRVRQGVGGFCGFVPARWLFCAG
jgi:hypothetical protein